MNEDTSTTPVKTSIVCSERAHSQPDKPSLRLASVAGYASSKVIPMIGAAQRAVSREQAGALLGVSAKTIERLNNRGVLPGFRIGWKWRVMLADIEAYVARQQASERRRIGKSEEDS